MTATYSIRDELDTIKRNDYAAGLLDNTHKALDALDCPECGGAGIAVEYDLDTLERREVWCECGGRDL